uniref:Uncharacterized protein n=1 Tax=Oryza rufipogon TaxID=4529 RepID=A0A0E0NAM0_ORYRU
MCEFFTFVAWFAPTLPIMPIFDLTEKSAKAPTKCLSCMQPNVLQQLAMDWVFGADRRAPPWRIWGKERGDGKRGRGKRRPFTCGVCCWLRQVKHGQLSMLTTI